MGQHTPPCTEPELAESDPSKLALLELENASLRELVTRLEGQLGHVSSLYAAAQRLTETRSQQDVLDALCEIIGNLVGCERFGVFELSHDARSMWLLTSMGIEAAQFGEVAVGRDPIGSVAQSGQAYFAAQHAVPTHVAVKGAPPVCIPLLVAGRVVGVIAFFEFLPQKLSLVPFDHEVFELLTTQGARAIFSASRGLAQRRQR